MSNPLILIAFGVLVGVFSGVMGLGGGAVMIPIMVLVFGLSQPMAHGTSLAVMLPMVTLPAVIEYYRHGNVCVAMAVWMAVGFMMGSFFGAYVANAMRKEDLKLVFGFVLIYVAAYTVFGKENLARTTALSALLVVIAMGVFAAVKWYDRSRQQEASPAGVEMRTPEAGASGVRDI
ncbi:MAG TPA: sulfite exporter TauE/SafE family protein [Tepidisphaeraceae bacterium]|nr:sulfite exporter TauE/SafE family protein [Tepidisphaeraceae bacterium]